MRTTGLALLLALAPAAGLRAQVTAAPADTAHPARPFFTTDDALLAAAFAAGTVALLPVDRSLATNFRKPVNQASATLHDAARFFNFMGDPGAAIISPSLYVVGRLAGWQHIAKLGLHSTEAVVMAGTITNVLKWTAGRARPYVTGDSVPHSYKFLRGLKGNAYQSFPSGHATAAFAFAAAMTAETSHWIEDAHAWPGLKFLVGGAFYGGASVVGLARIYDDRHWASDVLAGAAVGTFSGIKVVRYAYRHPQNRVERWLLGIQVLPSPEGGTVLAWSAPAPF